MTKPIPDKAEVALEYPDKVYIGTFERSARFDAHLDARGIALAFDRCGDTETRKSVRMHFHYGLFADVLEDLARTVAAMLPDDTAHRERLRDAARALWRALEQDAAKKNGDGEREKGRGDIKSDIAGMSPEEEVLLLHVME
jgi:hypothetical protein